MRQSTTYALFVLLVLFFAATQSASANLYAGNRRSSSSGVKAIIYAPSAAPTTPVNSGQYNWVGAVGNGWVQTGWKYNPHNGDTQARAYTEALVNGVYSGIIPYGTHSWGSGVWYRVQYAGSSTWNAYIADTFRNGWGPLSDSIEMQAVSEVWGSSSTQLSTRFSSVQYRNSSGVWNNFDQALWIENSPYRVDSKTYKYKWTSFGP